MPDDELLELRRRRREEILSQLSRRVSSAPSSTAGPHTPNDFDAFIRDHPRVLVDVWASWCGPCRTMEPIVEEIARENVGRMAVAKVDADERPDIVARFGVQGIPTFLLFKDGRLAARLVGVHPKADLERAFLQLG